MSRARTAIGAALGILALAIMASIAERRINALQQMAAAEEAMVHRMGAPEAYGFTPTAANLTPEVLGLAPSHSLHFQVTGCSGTCTGTSQVGVTPSVTAHFLLSDVQSWRQIICAASGQTLSGTGTLQAQLYPNSVGIWARSPNVDWAVPAACSGFRCCASGNFPSTMRFGDFYYPVASAVGVAGGTTLDVYVDGWTLSGT